MQPEILKPWEQRENESQEAYEAFSLYRSMGAERSLAKVAEKLGKSTQLMERWSQRDGWVKRCLASDRHEARVTNEIVLLGTAAMRKRLASQAMNMQLQAARRIHAMTDDEMKRLTPAQVVQFFRAASDVEMKARAIPESEMDSAERDDAPVFNISFLPGKPEGMISVRLPGGTAGYIPKERLEDFMVDHPEAVAIL